jgi:hypothetical protein
MNKFNRQGGLARFDELYSLASAYVNQLQALSVRDPERVGRYLNKANVLRLIELYVHTIPAFGHVRHAQELLFETTHQLLKRAIFRSNMKDPQVTAVGATLSNYWETRLSMEVESLVESLGNPETWTDAECLRVQRLIAGKKETALPNMDQVRSVFCNPVLSELSQVSRRLTSREADGIMWRIEFEDPSRLEDVDGWIRLSTQYASVFQDALEHIRITQSQQSFRAWSVREANHASSWSTARSVRNAIPELRRRNGIIRTSFVVQALTSRKAEMTRLILTSCARSRRVPRCRLTRSVLLTGMLWACLMRSSILLAYPRHLQLRVVRPSRLFCLASKFLEMYRGTRQCTLTLLPESLHYACHQACKKRYAYTHASSQNNAE